VRAQEICEQAEYAMTSPRGPIRVTVLEIKPPESGLPAQILVRPEQGVSKGREFTVTSRRIRAPWEERNKPRPQRPAPPAEVAMEASWPPAPGDLVRWSKTGPIEWTVEEVNNATESVRITAPILETEQTYTDVSFDELEPVERAAANARSILEDADEEADDDAAGELIDLELSRHGKDLLEHDDARGATVDRLLFSDKCLSFYRQKFAPKVKQAETADHLRSLLLREGELVRPKGRRRGYIHVRVAGQFDVVLRHSPGGRHYLVDGLALPAGQQSPAAGPTRRKERHHYSNAKPA
jgi:hypothetical protein